MADAVHQLYEQQIKFTFGQVPSATAGTDVLKTALLTQRS